MLRFLIGAMLIVHGLIVAAQSPGAFRGGEPLANPSWLAWWPTALGQSWLLAGLGLEQTVAAWLAGLLWLIGGVALVAAGLGVFGVLVPQGWWRALAIGGAGMSLLMLLFYLHPFYGIGTGLSAAILLALLWVCWPTPALVGS
jgi:hypothetical protein